MAISGTDIITNRARVLLNDTSTQSNVRRWSDQQLLLFLNDGETLIVSIRSDAKLASDGTILTLTPLTALGENISIADKWMLALVAYVCSKAQEIPGKGRINLDASRHFMNQFNDLVKTL